jgi:hypothetical protein
MDAFTQNEGGAYGAYDGGFAAQAKLLAQLINTFNAGAVRPQKIRNLKWFELVGGPADLFIAGGK